MKIGKRRNRMKPLSSFNNKTEVPFNVGDSVVHKKFGTGKVLDIHNNILTIQFNKFTSGKTKVVYKKELFN
jgi:hypothetical protein